jgi:hypothetical protein
MPRALFNGRHPPCRAPAFRIGYLPLNNALGTRRPPLLFAFPGFKDSEEENTHSLIISLTQIEFKSFPSIVEKHCRNTG